MKKKRIFGIVVVIVIIYFTYQYMKGQAPNTENSESNSNGIDPDANLELTESPEVLQLRSMAYNAYKDLKGAEILHPEPYKPIVKLTQTQFNKFLEIYKEFRKRGFIKHVKLQAPAAWKRTPELYQLKLQLDRLIDASSESPFV